MNLRCAMAISFAVLSVDVVCARADVVVVSNRTPQAVTFRVAPQNRTAKSYRVAARELVSIPVTGPLELVYKEGESARKLLIDPNSVCFFSRTKEGKLDFNQIGFSSDPVPESSQKSANDSDAKQPLAASARDPFTSNVCTIPVKIFVDDEEPFVQKRWEKRLRERMREASDILEQHCRVRFEVVAADLWDSNNEERDFRKMLAEFEREVRVEPAALAIGFSSQKKIMAARTHLGGTFAPLRRYILIREWSKTMSDSERLEVLLHELGHYLGATHSPEKNSVMRPILNDGQSKLRSFHIGYDPVNTLVMCLVGEEIRAHQVRHLSQLSPKSRRQLRSIYAEIIKITPDDSATVRLLQLVSESPKAK